MPCPTLVLPDARSDPRIKPSDRPWHEGGGIAGAEVVHDARAPAGKIEVFSDVPSFVFNYRAVLANGREVIVSPEAAKARKMTQESLVSKLFGDHYVTFYDKAGQLAKQGALTIRAPKDRTGRALSFDGHPITSLTIEQDPSRFGARRTSLHEGIDQLTIVHNGSYNSHTNAMSEDKGILIVTPGGEISYEQARTFRDRGGLVLILKDGHQYSTRTRTPFATMKLFAEQSAELGGQAPNIDNLYLYVEPAQVREILERAFSSKAGLTPAMRKQFMATYAHEPPRFGP